MSQENVDILHRVYELTETRGVEGLLELATDDIIWISDPRFPGGGTRVGKENGFLDKGSALEAAGLSE